MPRVIPEDRFEALIDAATAVFLEQGYRRTQIADVAARMGLAKGSIYTYVESKEALFDQVLRHADHVGRIELPATLPVRTPSPGATVERVRRRLAEEGALPALDAALSRSRVRDFETELETVLGELYDTLASHRTAIKLVDRCARDYPELAKLWFRGGRETALAQLSRYLETRVRRRGVRRPGEAAVEARIVLETLAFWAVHRHFDPSPQAVDDDTARHTAIGFLSRALRRD